MAHLATVLGLGSDSGSEPCFGLGLKFMKEKCSVVQDYSQCSTVMNDGLCAQNMHKKVHI